MPVPIPPHSEQLAIANEVERQFTFLDEMEFTARVSVKDAASLRSSVLAAAFTGKLVPQDPDDEPGSMLLERIDAERAASSGQVVSRNAVQERLLL